jgi:hypothetical protein
VGEFVCVCVCAHAREICIKYQAEITATTTTHELLKNCTGVGILSWDGCQLAGGSGAGSGCRAKLKVENGSAVHQLLKFGA